MADRNLRLVSDSTPRPNRKVVPNEVLGILIFILTELMFFGGFISAHAVAAASVTDWPPPDQPRLPVTMTAVNTALLLVSAGTMWWAGKQFLQDVGKAVAPMVATAALGTLFVALQGVEWVQLIAAGLDFQGTAYAGFFYLIVGAHGLHCIAGLGMLAWLFLRLRAGTLTKDVFWAGRLFWYFVVGLWPVIYYQVYL